MATPDAPQPTSELQGTAATDDGRAVEAADVAALTVLLDGGARLPVDAGALRVGGLRRVRPGQRLRLRVVAGSDGPRVSAATLPTAPWPDAAAASPPEAPAEPSQGVPRAAGGSMAP